MLSPELVHKAFGRDRLVDVQQEQREQGALLAAAERERSAGLAHLQGAEDQEFQRGSAEVSPAVAPN
jgi:hypothetical protein